MAIVYTLHSFNIMYKRHTNSKKKKKKDIKMKRVYLPYGNCMNDDAEL